MLEQGKTFSHLQLVMDDDIHKMIKFVLSGIPAEGDRLAVESIDRVGPGGNYLIDDLTLKYFKIDRLFPTLMLRGTREAWVSEGAKSFRERARERVKHILATHQPAPLDENVSKELAAIVEASNKTLMPA